MRLFFVFMLLLGAVFAAQEGDVEMDVVTHTNYGSAPLGIVSDNSYRDDDTSDARPLLLSEQPEGPGCVVVDNLDRGETPESPREIAEEKSVWGCGFFSGLKSKFRQLWHGWEEASWAKRIVWVSGGMVAGGVGGVVLGSTCYAVYHGVKAITLLQNSGIVPTEMVNKTTSMVLVPTPSSVVTSFVAGASGAAASTVLTPTRSSVVTPTKSFVQETPTAEPETPTAEPFSGKCTAVKGVEKFKRFGDNSCVDGALYKGRCIPAQGCSENGEFIYAFDSYPDAVSCRCPRPCNAPPVSLPCYQKFYGRSCAHLPECDGGCRVYWCPTCGAWSDPAPSYDAYIKWARQYDLTDIWSVVRCSKQ